MTAAGGVGMRIVVGELQEFGGLLYQASTNQLTECEGTRLFELIRKYPNEVVSFVNNGATNGPLAIQALCQTVLASLVNTGRMPEVQFRVLLDKCPDSTQNAVTDSQMYEDPNLLQLGRAVSHTLPQFPRRQWERLQKTQDEPMVSIFRQFFPLNAGDVAPSYNWNKVHVDPTDPNFVIPIEKELKRIGELLSLLLDGMIQATNPELNKLADDFGDNVTSFPWGVREFLEQATSAELVTLRKKFPVWFPS